MPTIRIIIHGCNGKMGQTVASVAAALPDIQVVAGGDKFPEIKQNPFPTYGSLSQCNEQADVIVDFSNPTALPDLLAFAKERKIPLVIATTGFSQDDIKLIEQASRTIPIFRSANMSLGVNVMLELVQKAAAALGNEFDIEIIEKHHNQKVDAPSGTAYVLADAINEVLLNSKDYIFGRHSKNQRRSKSEIGIHAVRGGTIPGQHTVVFAGNDEVLEITHTAYSRQIFALGALHACKYITKKAPGLYGMKDMLNEQAAVTNIYSDNQQALITINSIPDSTTAIAQILESIAQHNINIDLISQTTPVNGKVNISFTLPRKDLKKAMEAINGLKTLFPSINLNAYEDIVKLSVEGSGMAQQPGIASKVFSLMAQQNIRIMAITTSETKISYIIHPLDERKALEALMEAFEL